MSTQQQRVVSEAQARKAALLRQQAATEAQLARGWVAARDTLLRDLAPLTAQIDQAHQAGEPVSQAWLTRQQHYQALLAQVQGQINAYARSAQQVTASARVDAAQSGATDGGAVLDASVPRGVTYTFAQLPPADVMQFAAGRLASGQPLATLFEGWGEAAAADARDTLFTGITLGWNPRQTARAMARTLGKGSYARALTIARNETTGAYRRAQLATYRANADVVEQWRWLAAHGARTCGVCLAMDGTLHDLDEDLESHVNCRCVAQPITRSWRDILGSDAPDNLTDVSETSAGAGSYQTGAQWFDAQPAATQRAVLGPAKYAAYAAGDLALSDLVGVAHSHTWGTSRYERSLKVIQAARSKAS